MYNQDKLITINNNMTNSNLTDARKGIKDYGIKDFPSDYSSYLTDIFYNDPQDAFEILAQLDRALVQMQFIN